MSEEPEILNNVSIPSKPKVGEDGKPVKGGKQKDVKFSGTKEDYIKACLKMGLTSEMAEEYWSRSAPVGS